VSARGKSSTTATPPGVVTSRSTGVGKESRTNSILSAGPKEKRRRQRIVDLDGSIKHVGSESEDGVERSSGEVIRRSTRALGKMPVVGGEQRAGAVAEESNGNGEGNANGNNDGKPSVRSREEGVVGSAYKGSVSRSGTKDASRLRTATSNETRQASDPTGEDLRAKMEALKLEVGDSWLKVLTGQAKNASQIAGNGDVERNASTSPRNGIEDEEQPSMPSTAVVQIVPSGKGKKKKKKKAAASAQIE
jgi:hypothetical protein